MPPPLSARLDPTALDRAVGLSRTLQRLFENKPVLREEVAASAHEPLTPAGMAAWLDREPLTEDALKPRLRRLRQRVLAHVAVRDLAGLASLAEVTGTMSALAELAVTRSIDVLLPALQERHGQPGGQRAGEQDFIVLGMGKLGGRELNVSSDIDLIFVYPEEGESAGPVRTSNFEFYTRLGRRLIDALADMTGDGQVFRVDMRLRPNGDSGPLVANFDMLENYFITQGREWERYAWIKARPMTGARVAELESIARPFVYRKYLDYGAFNAMRGLHAQIRREVTRRDMANNVKLGPGGIREIEFVAQVFQLIRGGRDPALRIRPTLQVLDRLLQKGILDAAAVGELSAAYDFLRRVEHRLQYLDDRQTHDLPDNARDRELVALGMGFSSVEGFLAELDDHRAAVSRHFEAVFADPSHAEHGLSAVWNGAGDGGATAAELGRLGYRDPESVAQRLGAMRVSGRYREMPAAIRSRFDAVIPRAVEASAATANPDATLARLLDLLDAISRRGAYLALLQQYPHAMRKVADLMSASSWAAEYLTRHPVLLDELLDPRLLEAIPQWPEFRAELERQLDELEPDMERQMDVMREAHHAQVFRLLTQDLAGVLTVERLADHLSALADLMLDLTIRLTWRKLRGRHCGEPRFAVVAYGKLGGKELGYASDLDLVFLYEDEHPEAPDTYARLAQRISTWLTSRTTAGILFETDLRLRPSGEAGLLVSPVEAFRHYQMESAWMWEHQALTRARWCAGDADIGRRFEEIRIEVLRKPRDLAELRRAVLEMRQKMRDAHSGKSPLFDLKHDRGGLIDVEFMVQYLVLGHAHAYPQLTGNLGNIALLRIAADLGLIPGELADAVRNAYREYRHLQHRLRLNGAQQARVDPGTVASLREAVRRLWAAVFGEE
ncbi:MAG TPA: bifunctional [glutamate--ammonia ligase]-adenylyl-L-tyrosine phosphorylase/[glutamate--ammonia-ligase] adenylyltransferase [Rhodocyclaceae bacterium]|nr:bifunctional [glutamate--ammonia ligase]-adenylyl-L-tyrosine phosphorylase/[glutamate--ammonia-ligase] adenylyltransferase [Rhodocyclaceae bacterium]